MLASLSLVNLLSIRERLPIQKQKWKWPIGVIGKSSPIGIPFWPIHICMMHDGCATWLHLNRPVHVASNVSKLRNTLCYKMPYTPFDPPWLNDQNYPLKALDTRRTSNGVTLRVYSLLHWRALARIQNILSNILSHIRTLPTRSDAPVWVGPKGWARSHNLPWHVAHFATSAQVWDPIGHVYPECRGR